jgi:hypothetical protein
MTSDHKCHFEIDRQEHQESMEGIEAKTTVQDGGRWMIAIDEILGGICRI